MSNRNRTAGLNFERYLRLLFRKLGWETCETSRYASREVDDSKVDLCYTEPFNIQAKYTQTINMHTLLASMPKDKNYNIVFHKRKNKGVVVAMEEQTFIELISMLKGENII